jgi:hypothetical protein
MKINKYNGKHTQYRGIGHKKENEMKIKKYNGKYTQYRGVGHKNN